MLLQPVDISHLDAWGECGRIERHQWIEAVVVEVTASVASTGFREHGTDAMALVRRAGVALSAGRQAGIR